MTTTAAVPQPPAAMDHQPLLDDFFERLRAVNPFLDNRVNGPALTADVPTIHQAAFDRLTSLAREACDQRRGLGAVLWGEAGIGKSHLLARLSRWAEDQQRGRLVLLHNLQASPDNLPRSLLRAVVSILTRGQSQRFHATPLFRLVMAGIGEALRPESPTQIEWSRLEWAYHRFVDRLAAADPARAALVDRTTYQVLLRFFHSGYFAREGKDDGVAALAVRWLSGDYLDPEEARCLGLPPGPHRDEPVALADNQQIKQVLVALSRLALSHRQPFLLCFDQVDNLDREQMAALARFLEALLDSAPDLLVVTAGIQPTLQGWRHERVIQHSAWDRLAQFEVQLNRLSKEDARRMLAARIENFMEPFHELDAVRQRLQDDPLFPLGQAWYDGLTRDKVELRPRDVINWAREAWRRQQELITEKGGPAWLSGSAQPPPGVATVSIAPVQDLIDREVARHLAEQVKKRDPRNLPPDADHLAGLVAALLQQCLNNGPWFHLARVQRQQQLKTGPQPAYDLLVRQRRADGKEVTTGMVFLATASAGTTTNALKRLVQDAQPPERVWLVTDQRRPLQFGARGHEYLEQLQKRGGSEFRHIELTFPQYAELDALRATAGVAASGDVEIELSPGVTRRVNEQEAAASLHKQGRYQSAALLREL
jgi:AAA ATPase domain